MHLKIKEHNIQQVAYTLKNDFNHCILPVTEYRSEKWTATTTKIIQLLETAQLCILENIVGNYEDEQIDEQRWSGE